MTKAERAWRRLPQEKQLGQVRLKCQKMGLN